MNDLLPTPPFVIAHRGDSLHAPENTEAAVRLALASGAAAVECDVQLSADGIPMVFHDDDLQRLCGRPERVNELSAAALRELSVSTPGTAGTHRQILDLDAWLALLPADVVAVVEIKQQVDEDQDRRLTDAVAGRLTAHPGRKAVISFGDAIVQRLSSHAALPRGPIRSRPRPPERLLPAAVDALVQLAQPIVVVKQTLLDPLLIARCHAARKQLWSYALDRDEEIRHALEIGVDGLISNDPGRARAHLSR